MNALAKRKPIRSLVSFTGILFAFVVLIVVQFLSGCAGVVTAGGTRQTEPAALKIAISSVPSGKAQTPYSATLSATGGTSPYTWSVSSGQLPPGTNLNSSSGVISGTPTQSGSFSFTAKIVDSGSPVQSATVNLSIQIAATIPPLQITSTSLPAAETFTAYNATVSASGGTAPYTWSIQSGSLPDGLTLSSAGQITGAPTQNGNFAFTLQVKDSSSPAQTVSASFSISVALNGGTLQVTTVSLPNGQSGVAYSAAITALGGIQPYTWAISSGNLPAGLSVSSANSKISGTPTQSGSFTFTLQVQDSSPTPQTASKSFTISIAAAVAPLAVSTSSLTSGQVNSAYAATLTATGGTTPYSWSISSGSLPTGLSLNASTGQIGGTPTQAGSSSFTVQVKDSSSPTAQTATKSLTITIAAAVTPVQITTGSVPSGQVGTAYSTTLVASGGTTPYSWSISSGALPAGLTLSAASGTISGTPTTSGSFSFTAKVTDSTTPTAQTATKSLTITIAAAVTPVQITTGSVPAGQVGVAYSTMIQATGGTTPYSWSISSGALPAGLTLSAATGTISGTPTTSGSFTFSAKVTDSTSPTAQTASQSFTLTIATAPLPVQITTSSVPSGQVGNTYSTTLAASGGSTPYSWSITSGALPGGLTLSASSGTISGVPTTSGTFTFAIQVNDSSSPAKTATGSFSITVAAGTAYSVLLDWTASASPAATGYNVYRSQVSGSGYVKLNTSALGGLSYSDATVADGQTYYYVTTSVDASGDESDYSEQVQMVIP